MGLVTTQSTTKKRRKTMMKMKSQFKAHLPMAGLQARHLVKLQQ